MVTFTTLTEAAKTLGVAPSTLRHQIRLGRLYARKIGRGWYVTPEEVERYRTVVQGKVA
jgi:excisionase family DNA binding protein